MFPVKPVMTIDHTFLSSFTAYSVALMVFLEEKRECLACEGCEVSEREIHTVPLSWNLLYTTTPNPLHLSVIIPKVPYSGTPPSYGYDLEQAEEHQQHHDLLPFSTSPSSSPRLRSKSCSSQHTHSSGSLESTLSVRLLPVYHTPPSSTLKAHVSDFSTQCSCLLMPPSSITLPWAL